MTLAYSDPAFRAWRNALRIPNGIDRDELLAAGVILDEDDWQLWTAKGWFAFVTRAAITDAQELALFGLVQERLKGRKLVALPADLADAIEAYRQASLTYLGDCWLPEGKDESGFDAHWHRQREAQQTINHRLGSLTDAEVAAMSKEAERRRAAKEQAA